jgi:signal transduction histidine kinase
VRRQILLTVAASTLVVLVAFLVPLAWLVRSSAADRATSEATLGVQPIAAVAGTLPVDQLQLVVAAVRGRLGEAVTVFLPDGSEVGDQRLAGDSVRLARRQTAFSADLPGGGREILIPVTSATGGTTVVRVEIPASRLAQGVSNAWFVLGLLGLVLLALALLVADRVARSLLVPMHALTETASRLGAGDLDARVVPSGPAEVAAAGRALNRLGGRIVDLLRAEREQVADLSHRLRTPLSALRLDAEGLRDEEERDRLGRDVAGLTRVVDQVITEARRPVREGVTPTCDAAAVVATRIAFWQVLADDTDRTVSVRLDPGPIPVAVVEADLADAVDAVLGNVFAHTPDGTPFSVELTRVPGRGCRLVVEDAGPGLPFHDVVSRGSSGGGSSGLGLDIARRSAEASGGRLSLLTGERGGVRVVVYLGPPVL